MGLSNAGRVVAIRAALEGTQVGLVKTTPSDTAAGTEVTGEGYSRQTWQVEYTTANPAVATNQAEILFPVALNDWGTVTYAVLYSTTGQYMGHMELLNPIEESQPMPRHVQPGDQLRFPAGALRFEVV